MSSNTTSTPPAEHKEPAQTPTTPATLTTSSDTKGSQAEPGFLDNVTDSIDKYLDFTVKMQLDGESDVFKILYHKSLRYPLRLEELDYYNYYKRTFRIEMLSAALTIPVMFMSYNFIQETRKTVQNEALINKQMKRLLWVGLPAVNLFLIGLYRRYMSAHKYEDVLKNRYSNEIRRMKAALKQSEGQKANNTEKQTEQK